MRKCKNCGELTENNYFCSNECNWDNMKGKIGKDSRGYKKTVGINQVHKYLDVHYGQPRICEGKNCDGKTENSVFHWALKKGKKYERKSCNFLRLCCRCHKKYDSTPEKRKQAITNLINHNPMRKPGSYDNFKKKMGWD